MGSKNLRSSGSSASGSKGGLKAWLHRKKDADISTESGVKKRTPLFRKKQSYSVSRSPDFNWSITRYDRDPMYQSAREAFEERRRIVVVIPKTEKAHVSEVSKAPSTVKQATRSPSVPTLDVYFKEESAKIEAKAAERIEVKPAVKSFRQQNLVDVVPKMVEKDDFEQEVIGKSFFDGMSSAVVAATCSTAAAETSVQIPLEALDEDPAEKQFFDDLYEDIVAKFIVEELIPTMDIDKKAPDYIISDISSSDAGTTEIEVASAEDLYVESLCDDIATFTVMNDMLPEIIAEDEFAETSEEVSAEDPAEKQFFDDLYDDITAEFIVYELMPELEAYSVSKYVPEYVISEITDNVVSETVIELPEPVHETAEIKDAKDSITAFLFGFGRSVIQREGSTGFRFSFGKCDEADYDDDDETSSATVSDAAVTAASMNHDSYSL